MLPPQSGRPQEAPQREAMSLGKLKFWIESEDMDPITIGPGDVLTLPSNLSYKAEALEDTLDVDIFAPSREDWLKKEDDYLRG